MALLHLFKINCLGTIVNWEGLYTDHFFHRYKPHIVHTNPVLHQPAAVFIIMMTDHDIVLRITSKSPFQE